MEIEQLDILLRLLVAHLLADFVFQTDKIVDKKKKGLNSKYFYLHISIVGLLTYLFLAEWTNWWAPILMMVMHTITDLLKTRIKSNNALIYLVDQLLHFVTILILWILLTNNSIFSVWNELKEITISEKMLLIIIGYLLVMIPVSVLIGYMTQKWQKEMNNKNNESLTNAGKWIGIIERILIFTFILIKQWPAIGFLIAAKSVFRFGELKEEKERKKTEYILIGTLLSFTFAIIVGILIYSVLLNYNI